MSDQAAPERARIILRVSTRYQDEQNQLPDDVRWCDERGYNYDVAENYVIHGMSAFHKKQQAIVDKAISDMANGEYKVLVAWCLDRVQRPETLEAFILAQRVKMAGGRIEYTAPSDQHLNTVNEMSDVMLALAATMARQESKRKSERIRTKHTGLKAARSIVNKAPWGYAVWCTVCDAPPKRPDCARHQHRKIFRPAPGGLKYIPAIYDLIIDGNSLRRIADWLTDEGAGGKVWNGGYLADLIKNPAYYGQPRNAGELEITALVSYTVWQQANALLTSRQKMGRGAKDKALLKPECGDPGCDATGKHPSPMYRSGVGGAYYRCAGRGPQNKGCGNMVRLGQADEWVTGAMLADHNPHPVRIFVAGDARADQIGRLRERAARAYIARDPEFGRLDAEVRELEKLPAVAPHWEEFYVCHACGRVQDIVPCLAAGHDFNTNADHFAAMTPDEQREELAQRWVVTLTRDGVGLVRRDLAEHSEPG